MILLLIFLTSWVCAVFFFSAKRLFIYLWTTPDLNPPPFQRKASELCRALKNSLKEVEVNLGLGKVVFGFVFILAVMQACENAGLPALHATLFGGVMLLFCATFFILFGVIFPGILTQMFPEKLIFPYYYAYQGFAFIFSPLAFVMRGAKVYAHRFFGFQERFSFLTPDERAKLHEGNGQELDATEQKMIHSIFELGETEVKEIMVPRLDIIAVEEEESLVNIIKLINEHQYSRLPVYKKTIDSVTGIVSAKDLLSFVDGEPLAFKGEWDIRKVLRPAYFVPDNGKIDELFQTMKKQKTHLAVVVDEYGGTAGIVTLEDILEEIVGEIHDEYDKEEEALYKKIDEKTFILDPKINIDDLNHLLGGGLVSKQVDYETLGGFIFNLVGSIPKEGQVVTHGDLQFTILKMDGQRIERVRIEKLSYPISS